ncbi:MAG TPA: ABC transporter permease, partial [Albitalea sp.]|nr:ABC transporter permease [Albitalea sp.]
EAQANSTVVVLGVSLLPLVTLFNESGDAPWHLWVPALAQFSLMTRVLKGEALNATQAMVPLLVCAALAAVGVWFVVRSLKGAVLKR